MADGFQEIVIGPRRPGVSLGLSDVFRYRELLFFLVWRDLKVRYKQSLLGVGWVLLRPLISMTIFSAVFGRLARLPSEGAPYPVFVLLGLIPWGYFSGTFSGSTGSIVAGGNLISKVYFPRVIVPLGGSLSNLVDVLITMPMLMMVMLYYGVIPGASALLAPVMLVFVAVTALGPGLMLSALNVKYRDVGHLVPFFVQVWMYVTPVIYPASFVPERYRWMLYINPMTGVVEAFRAAFLPGKPLDAGLLAVSAAVSLVMFLLGLYYFKSVERTFADNI
ncbi:MAG: ABC transporter permease [Nitrospirae bacterium]|nr:ABC transporter permease [Nitrospirota bacterium]MBI5696860.1 ABC transporter permease [Nitrospirota bacterium]